MTIPSVAQPPDPDWLNKRIAQAKRTAEDEARRRVLSELGAESLDAAKARIAAAKAAEEASKTELQKAQERANELATKASKAEALERVVSERAAVEMASLSDAQKTTVAELAGSDPAAQLQTIDRLRKGGLLTAPAAPAPAAPPPAPATAAPIAAPATSAPPTAGPGATPPPAPTDIKASYERLKASTDKRDMLAARVMAFQFRDVLFPQK